MKAVLFREHGDIDVLSYEEVPTPEPGPGEILLRVGAVSINPGPDTLTRSTGFGMPNFELPHVTGSDPAGEIAALSAGVTGFDVGDRVVVDSVMPCGECRFCRAGGAESDCDSYRLFGVQMWGGRAQYARVPASQLIALPDNVSFESAATLPVGYATAWHGISRRAQLSSDETLLVVGAGGGVGVAGVQLGKLIGARVIALTGADWKAQRLRELGADEVLSYRDEDWDDQVRELTGGRGADVVLDSAGTATWEKSVAAMGRLGRLLCCGGTSGLEMQLNVRRMYREQMTIHFFAGTARADVQRMVDLVAAGELEPVIDSRLPLSEAAQGERHLAAQEQFGKIILIPEGAPV